MVINIPNNIYSETVIFKTIYWFTGDYYIEVKKNDESFIIKIEKEKGNISKEEERILSAKINKHLIDNKTREIILNETKSIRDLTILKAFFHFDEMDKIELEKR